MKDNPPLLTCMETFIQVADSQSFSEAARRLGVSQPSVSRQIGQLEANLGVRLLQRTTRRISLTEAGEIYYKKARKIQRDVIEAGNSIAAFKSHAAGLLKIGTPIGWTEITIAPYLSEFLAVNPDLELDVVATDDVQDVVEERLDLVLRVGALRDSSYVAQSLGKVNFVMCATPDYLAQYGTPRIPSDLLRHNCIVFDHNNQWQFKKNKSEQIIDVQCRVNTNMVSMMISLAMQDLGITLLPVQLIRHQLAKGELVSVMQDYIMCYPQLDVEEVFVLYSNRKHLPAKVKAFIDFFKDKI